MPPREPKGNPKAAGQARKADKAAEGKNKEAAKLAAVEDAEWSKGAKGKSGKEDKAAKDEAARERKAEAARLLAAEEAALPSKPKAPVKGAKAAPAKVAAAKKPIAASIPSFDSGVEEPESFAASGIDDALDILTLVGEKTDKAAMGSRAAQTVELHPERRYKAAFEQYREDNLPEMKKDYPGLRLQQYHDRLHKAFEKSPLNPFNQVTLGYDATKEDKVNALKAAREQTANRLRDN